MKNQAARHASVRAITGTALNYNGDFHALFDSAGIGAGSYNGRLLAWINSTLGTTYANVNEAKNAYAVSLGYGNWDDLTEVEQVPLKFHQDFMQATLSSAAVLGPVMDITRTDVAWAFDSAGVLKAAPHNLLENPNLSNQTGAAASGWTDEFGVGTTTFIDNGDGSYSAVFVAANNRPHHLNAVTVVAEEIYTLSAYIEAADISSGNDLLLLATSTGGTSGDVDQADTVSLGGVPGWFAVAFLIGAGQSTASIRIGPGGAGSSTGAATIKEPSITKGYLPGMTALNTPVKLSGPPLGRWVGGDDGDEPVHTARVSAYALNGGTWEKRGLLLEPAATQDAPEPIDMTTWTASNVTVAKNKTGLDGVANNACTLTATADNGTVMQSITKSSAANVYQIYIKRLTGTGDVEMTLDGGSTWTLIEGVNPEYYGVWDTEQVVWFPAWITQTLANPEFGIRLTTDTDAVIVGINDVKTGSKPSSLIPVGGATRPKDELSTATLGWFSATAGTFIVTAWAGEGFETDGVLLEVRADGNNRTYLHVPDSTDILNGTIETASASEFAGAAGNAIETGARFLAGIAYEADDAISVRDGILSAADTDVTLWTGPAKFSIGMDGDGDNQWGGFIESVKYW